HNARLFDVTRRRTSELATFLGVAESLSTVNDPGDVLAAIARRLREALHSNSAEVYEYDAGQRLLTLCAIDTSESVDLGTWSGTYDLGTHTSMAACIDGRQPLVVRRDDPEVPELMRAELERWGTAMELWVPLVFADEALGLMVAEEVDPARRYTDDQLRLAVGIAAHAAVALENARAYERLERERAALARLNERLSAFTQLTGQMRGLLSEDELLELLGKVMSEALEFNQWVAYLYDPEQRVYNVAKAFGGTPEIDEHYATTPIPATVLDGLVMAARRISQSFFVDHDMHNWTDEENFYLPGEELVDDREPGEWDRFDTLFVPMVGQKGQLLGYIEAYDPRDRQRPTEELVRMIEVFAGKAASNIELQRAYGELEEQSRTDGLTGLYNHRFFQERLVAEIARAGRFGKPLTLLMIDVDDFKDYNDTYGHPQGDRLLKALADLLLAETRGNVDFVARYGGEEFVVLLPETGLEAAVVAADDGRPPAEEVAERIRLATERMATVEGVQDAVVTVSVGIAAFPEHAGTGDQLVANADKALYLAKRLGKDRTCVYGR
ncbi:MAG TPA: sensor domain-containing diguanylate cyclase, partial [Thermoleophilia bacterium]|nr:sensor domain-containing diguanylate cyclase [Thermoleophilia bacterium]